MKRGWCPSVHAPMLSGDGLLMRVKPFGGRLSAAMLRTLAVVAAGCGNGAIELTGRGNIQLRGLTEVTAPLAAAALVDAGLADADPAREGRRNVIAVPPCNDALVAAIEAVLADIPGLAPKFCVAIGPAPADIQVIDGKVFADGEIFPLSRIRTDADVAATPPLRPAGAERAGVRWGSAPPASEADGTAAADAGHVPPPHPALSAPSGGGEGELAAVVEAVRYLAQAANGLRLRAAAFPTPPPPPGLLLGLPFGQTEVAALMALADLITDSQPSSAKADDPRLLRHSPEERRGSSAFAEGGPTLRTTPWRSFLLEGPHDPAPFAAAGFITDPDDPRRSIAACAGAPACASASVPAREDAAFLASRGLRGIHVSGCAKGCAHPGATTTLVGAGGAYGLVRHGRAGDRPSVTGLTIAQAAGLLA